MFNNKTDWLTAEETCKNNIGGHLISFIDKSEFNFVKGKIETVHKVSGFWIGLNDIMEDGFYEYSDGTMINNFERVSNIKEKAGCCYLINGAFKRKECLGSEVPYFLCKYPKDEISSNPWNNVYFDIENRNVFCDLIKHECPEKYSSCFGLNKDFDSVCSGRAKCISYNKCDCKEYLFNGVECQYYVCYGVSSNSPNVCNGKGICKYHICRCEEGYVGKECKYLRNETTNIGDLYFDSEQLLILISSLSMILLLICFLCCCLIIILVKCLPRINTQRFTVRESLLDLNRISVSSDDEDDSIFSLETEEYLKTEDNDNIEFKNESISNSSVVSNSSTLSNSSQNSMYENDYSEITSNESETLSDTTTDVDTEKENTSQ